MAFATKYSLTWADVEGVEWEVYYQTDPWAGAVTEFTPGPDPLRMSWNGGDKHQPIVGSSVDMQMVYESAVDSLYTEESQTIKVLVRKGGGTIWTGYLSPGQYYRQFNVPKHYTTLTATDGLGELKNIKFEDSSGDPYYSQQTEIIAIANILQKTGVNFYIREFINIFEDNHDTAATDSALAQTYFYPEMYWDEETDERSDCYTVLSDILKKYGATVMQSEGIWYIMRANSHSLDTIYYRTFTYAGVYSSNSSFTTYHSVGADWKYIHADHELSKLPGVGRCEVRQDPPRRANMFKNGSFDEFTWQPTPTFEFYYWESGVANLSHSDNKLKLECNETSVVPADYLDCAVLIAQADSASIKFTYEATYDATPTYNYIYLRIKWGDYYLSTSGWGTSAAYYIIDVPDENEHDVNIDFPGMDDYDGGFITASEIDFRFYQYYNETVNAETDPDLWTNYLLVDNIRLEIGTNRPDYNFVAYDNPITINNIKEIAMPLGDVWSDGYAYNVSYDEFYINTYAADRDSTTTSWSIIGDPTASAPIAEVLARQTVEGFRRSIDVLRGTFRSDYYYAARKSIQDSNFIDEYGYNKRFFPKGITFNARLNEWSGEWVECPPTYTIYPATDEWASHDCGGDATITANSIEIDSWTSAGAGDFAYFDEYTAVAGETVRAVLTLTDDGSSYLPRFYVDGVSQTRAWGTNYYTLNFAAAGAKTFELNDPIGSETFNCTAVLTIYGITGI